MSIIINPGSENKGGTEAQAKINAEEWLKSIHSDGFHEVEMKFCGKADGGNWLFHFIHSVTKKVATLEIHGFTKEECKQFMFYPRVYWNGSSCSEYKIEDWLCDGFKFRIEYYRQ